MSLDISRSSDIPRDWGKIEGEQAVVHNLEDEHLLLII